MATVAPEILYSKQLTQSDAACSKQIKLPRNEAKKFVGDLRHKQSAALVVKDVNGAYWEFICTCYGCQYALSKVGAFAKAFNLKPGDTLSFYRDAENELRVSVNHNVSSVAKPRPQHGTRRKRTSTNEEQSPTSKALKCSMISASLPFQELTDGSTEMGQDNAEQQPSNTSTRLRLPTSFSGSGSCPSSPVSGTAILGGPLPPCDGLKRCAEKWHVSGTMDAQQLDSLQAVLLLQTLESLNSGPALFKRPEVCPETKQAHALNVNFHLSPLQVPDCLSPAQQTYSPQGKYIGKFGQDHSNVSEDTQGQLDILEDSTAGCSTPEPSPTASPGVFNQVTFNPVTFNQNQLLLSKQLSRMDVRCAHDSVGITFGWEDVAASQLVNANMAITHFNVFDGMLKAVYACTLSRSADGRFCYLTGLGSFLRSHGAEPGQSLCLLVNPQGTLLVALQA